MRKTPAMLRFEATHGGQPLEQMIVAALNEHGTMAAAARSLGIKGDTLYFWVLRLHIRVKTVAELPTAV